MSERDPMAKLVREKKWSDGRTGPVAGRSDTFRLVDAEDGFHTLGSTVV